MDYVLSILILLLMYYCMLAGFICGSALSVFLRHPDNFHKCINVNSWKESAPFFIQIVRDGFIAAGAVALGKYYYIHSLMPSEYFRVSLDLYMGINGRRYN